MSHFQNPNPADKASSLEKPEENLSDLSVNSESRRRFFHEEVLYRIGALTTAVVKGISTGAGISEENKSATIHFMESFGRWLMGGPAAPEKPNIMSRRGFFKDVAICHVNAVEKVIASVITSAICIPAMEALHTQAGNANKDRIYAELARQPFYSLLGACVIAPIMEEATYRGIPNWILGDKEGKQWSVGIASSFVFAAIHNLIYNYSLEGKRVIISSEFSTSYLPLPQFILGLTLWDISRSEGLYYAVFGHSFNNAIPTYLNWPAR